MSAPTKFFRKKKGQKRKGRTRQQQAEVEYALARERVLFGTLGAASPVRKIDPDTGEVVALIDPNTGSTLPMDVKQAKFPHIVEMRVPEGGFGKKLDAMYEWHIHRGIRAINSTGRRDENGRDTFGDALPMRL
jgi:hypothetical protein